MRVRAHAPLGVLALAGCVDFVDPTLGVCGNRVVEEGEACDDPDDEACGLPSEPNACRLLCDPTAEQSGCGDGQLCGSDGVCRRPSGGFDADTIDIDEEGARWMRVADLDGDGRQDLVVQFAEPDIKIFHFDAASYELVSLRDPFAGIGAMGDFDDDGVGDVFLAPEPDHEPGGSSRVSLWRGAADRSPRSTDFATLRTEGEQGRVLAPTPERDRVIELVGPDHTRHWSSGAAAAVEMDAMGFGAAEPGRSIPSADLDGGACEGAPDLVQFARPELAFAVPGAERVHVVSSCGGGTPAVSLPPVSLPGGRKLGGAGAFFFDADADGVLDLLAQSEGGRVHVAHGVGDGTFHSQRPPPPSGGDGMFDAVPLLSKVEPGAGRLLAVADFDADGAPELVTRTGYYPAPEQCGAECELLAWTVAPEEAVVVDFNHDGAPDIAAIFDDTLFVHLNGALPPFDFETHELELFGPTRHLVVGDFDRDTVQDLALAEFDDDFEQEVIVAVYGGSVEPFGVERFGPFAGIDSLTVEQGRTFVARVQDADGRPAGAFVRRNEPEHDFGVVALGLDRARVEGQDSVGALTLLEEDGSAHLTQFQFVDGVLSPHDVVVGEAVDLDPHHALFALVQSIDLEGDGTDELVVLGSREGSGNVWLARLDGSGRHWTVESSQPTGVSVARRVVDEDKQEDHPPPGGGPGAAVLVVDVESDGDSDILVTTDEDEPRLLWLENREGALVPGPILEVDDFELGSIAVWHPDEDGPRFVVGGGDGLAFARIDAASASIDLDWIDEDVEVELVTTADVDGDGLLDLVYASEDAVVVRLALEIVGF